MAKSKHKIARQAEAARKRKLKVKIIALACLVIIAAMVFYLIFFTQDRTRVFSDGYQVVNLRDDGTFSARLFHNTTSGTYTEITEGNASMIIFTHDGAFAYSRLTNDILILPNEWDDFHGHNMRLPRVRR